MEIRLVHDKTQDGMEVVIVQRRSRGAVAGANCKWNKRSPVRTIKKLEGWRERLREWCRKQSHTVVSEIDLDDCVR